MSSALDKVRQPFNTNRLAQVAAIEALRCEARVEERRQLNAEMRDYMRALSGMGASVIMAPEVASLLKESQGFNTKRDLAAWLADNVEKTVGSYWGNGVVSTMWASMAIQGLEPYASQRKQPPETMMKPFQARGIGVIVTGQGQTTWFATDFGVGRGVRVDDWK